MYALLTDRLTDGENRVCALSGGEDPFYAPYRRPKYAGKGLQAVSLVRVKSSADGVEGGASETAVACW
jgi:hypothetical protein